ncbi:MAG: ABC transporter permease subunit [Bryobacteraceae bacterium]|jgi:ABC-type transport system involved in multi-copper enzyme maturation permease subunit
MKVRAIALNTFAGFLRNKLIVLFLAVFVGILLLFLTPLLAMKAMSGPAAAQMESPVLTLVGALMTMISGFGSLLAAWSAADTVADEMKSGTILAVMARPVRRWEFLLGKYLGVQLLMAVYVLFMFGFSYLLTWIGGERIQTTPWVLIAYPLVRYAIYSAISMFLVTMMHPVMAFGLVLVTSILTFMVSPGARPPAFLPGPLRAIVYTLLPSTELLSESRFLTITQTSLEKITWDVHAITLSYGLDYALVCFLLAVWSFRRRSLSRD